MDDNIIPIITLLLEYGGNVDDVDDENMTVLEWAWLICRNTPSCEVNKESNLRNIIKFLISKGATTNLPSLKNLQSKIDTDNFKVAQASIRKQKHPIFSMTEGQGPGPLSFLAPSANKLEYI